VRSTSGVKVCPSPLRGRSGLRGSAGRSLAECPRRGGVGERGRAIRSQQPLPSQRHEPPASPVEPRVPLAPQIDPAPRNPRDLRRQRRIPRVQQRLQIGHHLRVGDVLWDNASLRSSFPRLSSPRFLGEGDQRGWWRGPGTQLIKNKAIQLSHQQDCRTAKIAEVRCHLRSTRSSQE
jgi:hypothetical protein